MSCSNRMRAAIAWASFVAVTAVFGIAPARACRPELSDELLPQGDTLLLGTPPARLTNELRWVIASTKSPFHAAPGVDRHDADQADLERALIDRKVGAVQRTLLREAAAKIRHGGLTGLPPAFGDNEGVHGPPEFVVRPPPGPAPERDPASGLLTFAPDMPEEFVLYWRGAEAWYAGRHDVARSRWTTLLALPPSQRRYRSTWAAYMLARAAVVLDDAEAVRRCRQVRELATAGFVDRLGLAAASLGLEAYAELRQGRVAHALDLYVQQSATGDESGPVSIAMTAAHALKAGPAVLADCARNERARRALTSMLVVRAGQRWEPEPKRTASLLAAWIEALRAAGIRKVPDADRLAWVAYGGARYDLAAAWADAAPEDSAITHWIRAKLLLRKGDVAGAEREMNSASGATPIEHRHIEAEDWFNAAIEPRGARLAGELGAVRFARGDFAGALEAFARGGYWLDAAYVADRVMTPEELQSFVDTRWTTPPTATIASDWRTSNSATILPVNPDQGKVTVALRHMLARRLTRLGRFDDARPYVPAPFVAYFEELVSALRVAEDTANSAAERAKAWWKAADVTRHRGLVLLASEAEPDWAATYGEYAMCSIARARRHVEEDPRFPGCLSMFEGPTHVEAVPPPIDEFARAERHGARPDVWLHYRYTAVEYAWKAAELMPDNDEETARVLYRAGMWIKDEDPQRADRFYKALVRRCGRTQLGREADRLRWFPPYTQ